MDPKEGEIIKTGNGIDLYASWMFDEGTTFTEYLVDVDFVKEEFDRDVDLELIDTDLFANQLEIHKRFLLDAALYESTIKTRSYMEDVAKYYEDNEMNEKCLMFTKLFRYFVFRKRSPADIGDSKKM